MIGVVITCLCIYIIIDCIYGKLFGTGKLNVVITTAAADTLYFIYYCTQEKKIFGLIFVILTVDAIAMLIIHLVKNEKEEPPIEPSIEPQVVDTPPVKKTLNEQFLEIQKEKNLIELSQKLSKATGKFIGTTQKIKCKKDFYENMMMVSNNFEYIGDKRDRFDFVFCVDVACCYRMLNKNLNIFSQEGYALLYIAVVITESNVEIAEVERKGIFSPNRNYSRESANELFGDWGVNGAYYILKKVLYHFNSMPDDYEQVLLAAELLSEIDTVLQQQYVDCLADFVNIFAEISHAGPEQKIQTLEFLSQYDPSLKPDYRAALTTSTKENFSIITGSVTKELDELIGLKNVKEEMVNLIDFIQVQQKRKEMHLSTLPISYHCVFSGSPGTEKTTVARILAQIYKDLGIIKKGHLVETDRSGLVAEYVGQTAVKTNKVINSAIGGVLFIDEAYSLYSESAEDYGKEAVTTLIKQMEDNRDNLVVILAGYTDEMKHFIDINPGLQSRFNRYIQFTDYQPDELVSIFNLLVKKNEYKLDEKAEQKLKVVMTNAYNRRDKTFGNARFVRNLFEKTLENHAKRVARISEPTKQVLTEIMVEDI